MNVKLVIQKVNEEYYCHGDAVVKIEVECARCLEMFNLELVGELNFVIMTDTFSDTCIHLGWTRRKMGRLTRPSGLIAYIC